MSYEMCGIITNPHVTVSEKVPTFPTDETWHCHLLFKCAGVASPQSTHKWRGNPGTPHTSACSPGEFSPTHHHPHHEGFWNGTYTFVDSGNMTQNDQRKKIQYIYVKKKVKYFKIYNGSNIKVLKHICWKEVKGSRALSQHTYHKKIEVPCKIQYKIEKQQDILSTQ